MEHPWHALSLAEATERLQTDPAHGLAEDEARARLARHGPNRLTEKPGTPAWRRLAAQLGQPLVLVLIVAGAITAFLGEWVDAFVILGVVVVNAVIGFVQEGRAEEALRALARSLVGEVAVRRAGRVVRLASVDLVPGDLVLLAAGDKVPADLRLTEAREFAVDEAMLTGESLPAAKTHGDIDADTVLAERRNMAYCGTAVTSGRAAGIVVATGDATETGRIAQAIASAPEMITPLMRQMARFSNWLLVVIAGLAALTFVVGIARGESAYEMFMAAVALAVGAVPEGLPAAITVTLAIGVARMARRRAIIRHLPAVETLGGTTVICSDKTGTLTENQMTVREVWLAPGASFAFGGDGYVPRGEVLGDDIARAALADCLCAAVLCSDATLHEIDGVWSIGGDPTEAALLVAARKIGIDEIACRVDLPRVGELPFDPMRQTMVTVHVLPGRRQLIVKGALERVLPLCADAAAHGAIEATAGRMAADGLRVLAIAETTLPDEDPAPDLTAALMPGCLNFLGLIGMLDPPRSAAIDAVKCCRDAGIKVKMITGDHAETARAIAGRLGIDNRRVLSGREIAALDAAGLSAAVREVSVFARVEPTQKLVLVQALQARGEVVAMTGDGVNDAPALKAADIGVAMGKGGTEVARDAAAMVLTDDNFATIVSAVEEGRGVYDNLIKFITWTLPTNLGEGLVILAAIVAGVALPITPLQILWINMTTAVLLGMTLAFEPIEPGIMARPPRPPRAPILDAALVLRILLVSALLLAGAFGLFMRHLGQGASLAEAQTVAMNVFVFVEIAYLFNCRSLRTSWIAIGAFSNRWFWAGIAAMVALQMLITYLPAMNRAFRTAPIGLVEWAEIVAVALAAALIVGTEKRLRPERGR